MRDVLFRADSSTEIGSGHIMRCLALAAGLREAGYKCAWVVREYPGGLSDKIKENYPVELIPGAASLRMDLEITGQAIKRYRAGVLVTDAYHLTGDYLQKIRPATELMLSIDDVAQTNFCSDILLNQNLGATEEDYVDRVEPYTQLLLGPKYALLRKEFSQQPGAERIINQRLQRLLITLGGSDPANQTLKVLQAVAGFELAITVVIGGGYKHKQELINFVNDSKRPAHIYIKQNVDNISQLMLEADLAISAGGSTCWELACLGLPNMILVLAENQAPIAQRLEEQGISVNLGWFEGVREADIQECLSWLMQDMGKRESMSRQGGQLVDGRGVDRVVKEIAASWKDRVHAS